MAGIARSHDQEGVTPLISAKIMMTTRLISILMTAVRVAETTTIYLGKLILRRRSPRLTMAWMPWEVHSVKKDHMVVPQRR